MLLFKAAFLDGIASGSVTLTFRHWRSERVKPGRDYPCPPIGRIAVEAVDRVAFTEVTEAEAVRAGYGDRADLRAFLERAGDLPDGDATALYRVRFRYLGPDDTRDRLAADGALTPEEVEGLAAKLAKLDRLSKHGPWTRRALALVAANPRVGAVRLAAAAGQETLVFKTDVRKLKNLGLTISHGTGYSISPRGRAFLDASGWLAGKDIIPLPE